MQLKVVLFNLRLCDHNMVLWLVVPKFVGCVQKSLTSPNWWQLNRTGVKKNKNSGRLLMEKVPQLIYLVHEATETVSKHFQLA